VKDVARAAAPADAMKVRNRRLAGVLLAVAGTLATAAVLVGIRW
jgi:hypothetical protein